VTQRPGEDPVRAAEYASKTLRDAYGAGARAVERVPDPGRAAELAAGLVRAAEEAVAGAAQLRARMARRLLEEEGLSLAQLATRLGVSKARADQLVRAARRRDGE
jgi:hypothetical protein